MRTQPPTHPFNLGDVDVTRYGTPQHEMSTVNVESLYGPPQHETVPEDPDWLISIASGSFSVEAPEPGRPEVDDKPAEPERERTVVRL